MSQHDRDRWNRKYRERNGLGRPSDWLTELSNWLDRRGESSPARAIDLAAGLGENAAQLADWGWQVTAVDLSDVAVAMGEAHHHGRSIDWVLADLDDVIPEGRFDLVCMFRFLDRTRLPLIVDRLLLPGGYIVAETFHIRSLDDPAGHVRSPRYLLRDGDWEEMFPWIEVLARSEVGSMSRFFGRRAMGR